MIVHIKHIYPAIKSDRDLDSDIQVSLFDKIDDPKKYC